MPGSGWIDDLWGEGSSSTFINSSGEEPFDNLTLTCAARSIQGPVMLPYSSALEITLRAIQFTYYVFFLLFGTFLNILVIVLVAKYKILQTQLFTFALQIVMLDLLQSVVIVFSLVNLLANKWVFGEHMCGVVGFLVFTNSTVRTILMFLFVIDRFVSVFSPFYYPKIKSKIAICFSLASWLVSGTVCIGLMPQLLDCYSFSENLWLCTFSTECSYSCASFFNTFSAAILGPASIIPIFLYAVLYCKAKRMRNAIAVDMRANDYRERERKATITFFLLFMTVFALLLPSTIVYRIIDVAYAFRKIPPAFYVVQTLARNMIGLVIITDPIVILRNPDVRKIVSQIKAKIALKIDSQLFHTNNSTSSTHTSP